MSTYAEWAAANPSDVHGDGWGADHHWHYEATPSNASYYKCALCYWPFAHAYNSEPDIFKAMKKEGVPSKCERRQMWPIRYEYASQDERQHWEKIRAEAAKKAVDETAGVA
jgi:hypothetical protein